MENQQKSTEKVLLKGLTLSELINYFTSIGEKRFRGEQVFQWMYNRLADDISEMNNIPKPLRNKLLEETSITALEYSEHQTSESGGTIKYAFKTADNYIIESVLIPEVKRTTLCISTQVGCPLDCQFLRYRSDGVPKEPESRRNF